ncbi:hypothetical protein FDI69_gp016 [Rhodococcus phage Trina]|uniref:Uncharacterized protein n=1 Tax=Rhodococcus phage Trina TaxID=2027905 RepID=A0A2D1AD71_9CAUD|nr:hypothetical protein FDI69_gp016 [Rhodococcus phage Trina]ASZ74834.1 hypothetical protein SEA_TRINA_16 [Rhodococcus phage Trina]
MKKLWFKETCSHAEIVRDPSEPLGMWNITYYSSINDNTSDEWYETFFPLSLSAKIHARRVMREHNKKPKQNKKWTVRV